MSSLCDICSKPGNCCKRLTLSSRDGRDSELSFWKEDGPDAAAARMIAMGLPFIPLEISEEAIDEASGSAYVRYFYRCPELLPTGRCGIYDNRPRLSRDYAPGTDALCVFASDGSLWHPRYRVPHGRNRSARQIKKLAREILREDSRS